MGSWRWNRHHWAIVLTALVNRLAAVFRFRIRLPFRERAQKCAMTSCRPSRRTSFPSLGNTTCTLVFRPPRGRALPRRRVSWSWLPGISGRDFFGGDDRISYVPGEPQLCSCLLFDPGRTGASGHTMRRRGPRYVHDEGSHECSFRGSITRLRHWLSTLRRPGYPDTTQDSLPAAGQALPGGLGYRRVPTKGFTLYPYIRSPFPKFNVAQGHSAFLAQQKKRGGREGGILRCVEKPECSLLFRPFVPQRLHT